MGAGGLEFFANRLGRRHYEIGAEALNFGAFIAFMGVNAALFVHYWLHGKNRTASDFLVSVLGFLICGFIWVYLSHAALLLGVKGECVVIF
jgi:putrescine importer